MRLTNLKDGKYKVFEDGILIGAVKIFEKPVPDVYTYIVTNERGKGYEKSLKTHVKKYLKRKGYPEANFMQR